METHRRGPLSSSGCGVGQDPSEWEGDLAADRHGTSG